MMFNTTKNAYKQLLNAFLSLERSLYTGQIIPLKFDLEYKFFTKLLLLIAYQREFYGAHIHHALTHLRQALKMDYKYHKQLDSMFLRSFIEMLMMVVTLGLFFLRISQELSVPTSLWFTLVGSWSIGTVLFLEGQRWLQNSMLKPFSSLFYALYYMALQLECAVDLQSLFRHREIQMLVTKQDKRFDHLPFLLTDLLTRIQEGGDYDMQQVKSLLNLAHELYEQQLANFYRRVGTLKFFIMAIFFLGSYLYHLVHIISSMKQLNF